MSKLNLGKMIRQGRFKKGITQQQLAEKLGYDSVMFISLMENNKSKVPLETLGKLIVILGLNLKEIKEGIKNDYSTYVDKQIKEGQKAV